VRDGEGGLILASASPRRGELLARAGYRFVVAPPEVEEWEEGTDPFRELCGANAALKARAVAAAHGEAVVLAADTMVALEGRVLGKPRDLGEARRMLERLSGRVHEVCTAVCIRRGADRRLFHEVSRVRFRELGPDTIREYTRRVCVLDKAGAYAVQEDGGMLVAEIEGSYENVMGLPIEQVAAELARFGVQPEKP